jgi:hypothetical protein
MNFEVQIDKEGFKGKAMLNFPTRSEKLGIIKELKELGYGSGGSETIADDKKLDLASRMGDVVDERLISIDVIHEESGVQITDKSMMEIYSECQVLSGILANFILGGVSLGKAKS